MIAEYHRIVKIKTAFEWFSYAEVGGIRISKEAISFQLSA